VYAKISVWAGGEELSESCQKKKEKKGEKEKRKRSCYTTIARASAYFYKLYPRLYRL
jgi:endonuclease I